MKASEGSLQHSNMAEDVSKEYAELMPVQMDFVSIVTPDTVCGVSSSCCSKFNATSYISGGKLPT